MQGATPTPTATPTPAPTGTPSDPLATVDTSLVILQVVALLIPFTAILLQPLATVTVPDRDPVYRIAPQGWTILTLILLLLAGGVTIIGLLLPNSPLGPRIALALLLVAFIPAAGAVIEVGRSVRDESSDQRGGYTPPPSAGAQSNDETGSGGS